MATSGAVRASGAGVSEPGGEFSKGRWYTQGVISLGVVAASPTLSGVIAAGLRFAADCLGRVAC